MKKSENIYVMKNKAKIGTYVLMMIFAAIIAGLYGAIHNQISYTISQEYFTKFKFTQFNISWAQDIPRVGAAYVGIIASWWVGAVICMVLGFFGLRFKSSTDMALYLRRSFFIVIIIAMLTGFGGLGYGCYAINEQTIDTYSFITKYEVMEPVQFIRVGFMHDAGYLGGVIGLLLGIMYLEFSRKKYIKPNSPKDCPFKEERLKALLHILMQVFLSFAPCAYPSSITACDAARRAIGKRLR